MAKVTSETPELLTFLEGCKRIYNEHMKRIGCDGLDPIEFELQFGMKNLRVARNEHRTNGQPPSRTVHCFIDMATGDVLKAASWKVPAKHARGNIFDAQNGLGSMNGFDPAYLR